MPQIASFPNLPAIGRAFAGRFRLQDVTSDAYVAPSASHRTPCRVRHSENSQSETYSRQKFPRHPRRGHRRSGGNARLEDDPLFDSQLLSNVLCFRYTPAMTKYEDIFDIAADNHGLITSAQAQRSRHNQQRARAIRQARARGEGRPRPLPAHAVGPRAKRRVCLGGHVRRAERRALRRTRSLRPAWPPRTPPARSWQLPAAAATRCRRASKWNGWTESSQAIYDGIPCQSAYDAILACKGKMLPERLLTAAETARRQGFISKQEFRSLKKELEGADASKNGRIAGETPLDVALERLVGKPNLIAKRSNHGEHDRRPNAAGRLRQGR